MTASYGHRTINRYHTRRTLQRLSAQLEALGNPGLPSLAGPQGAAVVFAPTPQIDFQLIEVFKDLNGDGVYQALANVLDSNGDTITTSQTGATSGTDTPDPPRQVTLYDRGGRYYLAKVGDRGQAVERLLSGGTKTWDVVAMRDVRPQYLLQVNDDTGTQVAGTPLNVDLNDVIHDKGAIWELDTANDDVEVLATGDVLIQVSASFEWISGTATSVEVYVTKDGTAIEGTRRIVDVAVSGHASCSISWVETIAAQEKLAVKLERHLGTGTVATVANGFALILSAPWTDAIVPLGWTDDLGVVFDFNDAITPYRSDNALLDPDSGVPTQSAGGPATDNFIEFENAVNSWLVYGNPVKDVENHFAIPQSIPSGFTFAVWVRLDDSGDYQIAKKTDNRKPYLRDEWWLEVDTSNFKFSILTFDSLTNPLDTVTKTHSTSLSLATWYFVVCQVENFEATGDRMRVGISVDGGAFQWSHSKDATAQLRSGGEVVQDGGFLCLNQTNWAVAGTSLGFVAYSVDMIRFWARAISDTEVAYHYSSGTGQTWPFI